MGWARRRSRRLEPALVHAQALGPLGVAQPLLQHAVLAPRGVAQLVDLLVQPTHVAIERKLRHLVREPVELPADSLRLVVGAGGTRRHRLGEAIDPCLLLGVLRVHQAMQREEQPRHHPLSRRVAHRVGAFPLPRRPSRCVSISAS